MIGNRESDRSKAVSINESAYEALCEVERTTGYPTHFKDDLFFHDRMTLGGWHPPYQWQGWQVKEGSPFLWVVRECGTHLIGLDDETCEFVNRYLIGSNRLETLCGSGYKACYLWNKGSEGNYQLTKVPFDMASRLLERRVMEYKEKSDSEAGRLLKS